MNDNENFDEKLMLLMQEVQKISDNDVVDALSLCLIASSVLGSTMNLPKDRLIFAFVQCIDECDTHKNSLNRRKLQ